MAALLAADLENFSANLVVGDRILGRAGITDDLHLRLVAELAPPQRSRQERQKRSIT
jgi:hypothetical protein